MSERDVQHYGTIVVVGGGCYGGYYVRQLGRALTAGAITTRRILVVDRDPACAVAATLTAPFELVVSDWREFFAGYLAGAASDPNSTKGDAIVPSPLMPHLMGEWLVGRARDRFGSRVSTRGLDDVPTVPWDRAGDDGTHYVSFATWMCPINCIEPRICPHTKGPRDWSMPARVAEHAASRRAEGKSLEDAVLFCRHRAFGVGMFDTDEVVAADARIRAAGERGATDVLIGTVSHCHGALTRLVIDAPSDPNNSQLG